MRRREFITVLGGAAAAWPIAARAQQSERMRRIGVLLPAAPDDAEQQSWLGSFLQGLAQSGWITGRNIRIETRWTKFDREETRKYAAELVALAPDVIVAVTSNVVAALQRETRSVPIVFVSVIDPVGTGLVTGLRGREATLQVLLFSNTGSARNGWRCSGRLHPASPERQFIVIPPWPPRSDCWVESNPWRRLCGWS